MSGHERTGWRDLDLSRRHRLYGADVPAVDIDLLLVEYDRRQPVAIIDYKASPAPHRRRGEDPNLDALSWLGERAGVPVFVVRYVADPFRFHVVPLTDLASGMAPTARVLSEREYVLWLWRLRGREAPRFVLDRLEGVA